MKFSLGISRRSIVIAAAAVATVLSLGLGANAALNKISRDTREAIRGIGSLGESSGPQKAVATSSRVALIIGNGHYPDAREPLTQPINDARALTAALRQDGFDVDVVEDANRDDMRRAIDRLKAKVRRDTVVLLFYGGYGIQVVGDAWQSRR